MSTRSLVATVLATGTVATAGVVGVARDTAPGELGCAFAGVSANETSGTFPTPIEAAAAHAEHLLAMDGDAIVSNRGVVDVTGSATFGDERLTGTVFAVRDHGRTIAFFRLNGKRGGWRVGTTYVC